MYALIHWPWFAINLILLLPFLTYYLILLILNIFTPTRLLALFIFFSFLHSERMIEGENMSCLSINEVSSSTDPVRYFCTVIDSTSLIKSLSSSLPFSSFSSSSFPFSFSFASPSSNLLEDWISNVLCPPLCAFQIIFEIHKRHPGFAFFKFFRVSPFLLNDIFCGGGQKVQI